MHAGGQYQIGREGNHPLQINITETADYRFISGRRGVIAVLGYSDHSIVQTQSKQYFGIAGSKRDNPLRGAIKFDRPAQLVGHSTRGHRLTGGRGTGDQKTEQGKENGSTANFFLHRRHHSYL